MAFNPDDYLAQKTSNKSLQDPAQTFDPDVYLSEKKASAFDPNAYLADKERSALGADYIPTESEFVAQKQAEGNRPVGAKVAAFGEAAKDAVGSVGKLLGEGASGVVDVANGLREDTAGTLKGLGKTAVEGVARGAFNFGDMIRKVSPSQWRELVTAPETLPYDQAVKAYKYFSGADLSEAHLKEMYKTYLNDRAYEDVSRHAEEGKRNIFPGIKPEEINQPLARLTAQVADPVTVATLGEGAVAEAMGNALGKQLLKKAVIPVAGLAEGVGSKMVSASEIPSKLVAKSLESSLGPEMAERAGHSVTSGSIGIAGLENMGVHIPVPGLHPVAKLIGGSKVLGEAAEKGGRLVGAVAKEAAEAPSQIPVFKRIAEDPLQPTWIRQASRLAHAAGVGQGAETVGRIAKAAGSGVAAGLAINELSGEDTPESLGSAVGSGAMVGTLLSPTHWAQDSLAMRQKREIGSIAKFMKDQEVQGSDVSRLRKFDHPTALAAATFSELFKDEAKSKFVDEKTYLAKGGEPGTTAFYQGGDIYVNLDSKNLNDGFVHEYGHALGQIKGKTSEVKGVVDSYLTPKGVENFKRDYASKFVDPKLSLPDRENAITEKVQQLNETHGDDWGYGEIFAEGFLDTFGGRNIRQTLDSSGGRKAAIAGLGRERIGFMADMLQRLGVPIDPKGTGEIINRPQLLANVSNPKLRELIVNYTKALDDEIKIHPPKEEESASDVITKEAVLKNDARLGASDAVRRDAAGNPIGLKTKAEIDAMHGKTKEDQGVIGKAATDFYQNYVTTGDEVGLGGYGTQWPKGFVDHMVGAQVWSPSRGKVALDIEKAIQEGRSVKGWYQSAYLNKGNMPVDFKDVTPISLEVTKVGNGLVSGIDNIATENKILRTFNKVEPIGRNWRDVQDYRNDIIKFVKNLREVDAGPNGIVSARSAVPSKELFGEEKAKLLNAFFNASSDANDANRIVNTSKARRDPDQLWKSYRIDRWNTLEDSRRQPYILNYHAAKHMFRPEMESGAPLANAKLPGEAARQNDQGFYSQVEDNINRLPEKFNAGQLKAALSPEKGVKPDELKWMGFDDFLKDKGPDAKLTKQEIQKWVNENSVKLQEVVKGAVSPDQLSREIVNDLPQAAMRAGMSQLDAANLPWSLREGRTSIADLPEALIPDAQRFLLSVENYNNAKARGGVDTTKFSNYQIPGGENYRELLLTLPPKPHSLEQWKVLRKDGTVDGTYADEKSATKRSDAIGGTVLQGETLTGMNGGPNNFRSSHFDEPNILAHVRFNEREVDGKKVLFIEEVQSDWHQKGRKEGYRTPREPTIIRKEFGDWFAGTDESNLRLGATKELAIENFKKEFSPLSVPDAPFKKTWHELALKRLLRYGAENGYDKVAWTNGDQQAARYDLSKQLDVLSAWPDGKAKDGSPLWGIQGVKAGSVEIEKTVKQSELESVVGKDIANKIINREGEIPNHDNEVRELRGPSLKVGGEGMKGFYDKILPSFMDKYGKKWGAKVGEMKMDASNGEPLNSAKHGEDSPYPDGIATVHSMDITPQMRGDVMQRGQPLFRPEIDRSLLKKEYNRQFDNQGQWIGGDLTSSGLPFKLKQWISPRDKDQGFELWLKATGRSVNQSQKPLDKVNLPKAGKTGGGLSGK